MAFPLRIAQSKIFCQDRLRLSIVLPLVGCYPDLHDDSPLPVGPLSEQPKRIGAAYLLLADQPTPVH
jgi:hypothetical protein